MTDRRPVQDRCQRQFSSPPGGEGPTIAPTGLAMFAGDFQSIRRFAERDHHGIVSWNSYDPGLPAGGPRDAAGHYAAHQATDLLAGDIRQFYARLA